MTATLLVLAVPIGLWVWFYPNPFHREGRFRRPGYWNGKFGKGWRWNLPKEKSHERNAN